MPFSCESLTQHMQTLTTLCGRKVEFVNVKAGGIYIGINGL
jgi:hypothetical protein